MSEYLIFAAAVKLSPEQQSAYLDQACAGNAELRRAVDALLHAHDDSGPLLNDLTGDYHADPAETSIAEGPGSTLGHYKLMEQIGEGGFGLVFVAEQQHPVRRKVALKILKPGMDTREVIARFEAERQALALMDHPNIAKVLDAGTTHSGRPYFVMELVKGMPLTDYCDQQQLTTRERLNLFLSVCQAVQHAHSKGVIHRDLKPSNILVAPHDGTPVVKVIDFGVAKAIGQQLTEKTIYTRFAQMIGTPLYMSPEQAEVNQLDVDTRSDVYSLGVVLYELLTGTTPIDRKRFAKAAYDEIRRIIKEEEPPKPSTRLSSLGDTLSKVSSHRKIEPGKLSALIRGDLDWIVMKALEKDRNRRYDTASSFAADVRRFLAEEPIEARPPSALYRFRKMTRRNKAALTTASIVVLALVVGLAASIWQAVRATKAETKALQDRDEKNEALSAATKARQQMKLERDTAQLARAEVRRSHYAATMGLIATAWQADNVKRVEELLEELRPQADDEDLRHFEWYYWKRQCNTATRTMLLSESGSAVGCFSGDGTRYAFCKVSQNREYTLQVCDTATGRVVFASNQTNNDRQITQLVTPLALNHDGTRLLVTNLAFGLRSKDTPPDRFVVWDVRKNQELFVTPADRKANSMNVDGKRVAAFSADGQRLATFKLENDMDPTPTSDAKGTISIWDINNPKNEPIRIATKNGPLSALTFNPEGNRIAGVFSDSNPFRNSLAQIHEWDTTTGKVRKQSSISGSFQTYIGGSIPSYTPHIVQITYTPDSSQVIGIGAGKELLIWSSEDFDIRHFDSVKFGKQYPSIDRLVVSGDGRRIAVWDSRFTAIRILDLSTLNQPQTLKRPSYACAAVFNRDGTRLITVDRPTNAQLQPAALHLNDWDIQSESPLQPERKRTPTRHVWSPDGQREAVFLSTTTPDKISPPVIQVRDKAGKLLQEFRDHQSQINHVVFSANGRTIQSRAVGGEVRVWEADTGRIVWSRPAPKLPSSSNSTEGSVSWQRSENTTSPDHRYLILLDAEADAFKIVNFDTLQELFRVKDLRQMKFSPNSKYLVTRTWITRPDQNRLTLWDLETGREIRSETLSYGRLRDITFSDDSRWYTTMGIVWNTATGERVGTINELPTNTLGSQQSAFSDHGKYLAHWDKHADSLASTSPAVYDIASGKLLFRLEGHAGWISSLVFSPGGKRIATVAAYQGVGYQSEIKLWETRTGRELLSFTTNLTIRGKLRFSDDGYRLLDVGKGEPVVILDATPRPDEWRPAK